MARESDGRASSERRHEEGPRVYRRGRYWNADLRPWGGARTTLRNPKHTGWPHKGDRTESGEEARRWAWEYVDWLRDGKQPKKKARRTGTIATLKEEYLKHRAQVVEDATVRGARWAIAHLLEYVNGRDITPSDINSDLLQGLISRRVDEEYEPATVHMLYNHLAFFFKWLDREDATKGVELPQWIRGEKGTWSDRELAKLREAADRVDAQSRSRQDGVARLALELGLATGGRQKELFGLMWQDFDAESSQVRVVRQQETSTKTKHLKGKLSRTALVFPEFWAFWRRNALGPILLSAAGRPCGEGAQRDLIKDVLRTAGLYETGIGWHSLRHTYAKRFIEAGGRMEELQKSLGHDSIVTTEKDYGHFHADVAAELARKRMFPDWRPPIAAV